MREISVTLYLNQFKYRFHAELMDNYFFFNLLFKSAENGNSSFRIYGGIPLK